MLDSVLKEHNEKIIAGQNELNEKKILIFEELEKHPNDNIREIAELSLKIAEGHKSIAYDHLFYENLNLRCTPVTMIQSGQGAKVLSDIKDWYRRNEYSLGA